VTFADLYGPAAMAGMLAAVTPAQGGGFLQITAQEYPDGDHVLVVVTYERQGELLGTFRCNYWPTRAFIPSLWLYSSLKGTGLVSRYAMTWVDWLGTVGVQEVSASPDSPLASWLFQRTSALPQADGKVTWRPDAPRRAEYKAWKLGQASEPSWHADLTASAPGGTLTATGDTDA
jgi:hypothetical protein